MSTPMPGNFAATAADLIVTLVETVQDANINGLVSDAFRAEALYNFHQFVLEFNLRMADDMEANLSKLPPL